MGSADSALLNKLESYADVAVKVGVNLQAGQNLYIEADVEAADFVRIVAKKAYEAGAHNVHFRYSDGELRRMRLMHSDEAALVEVGKWNVEWYQSILDEDAARLAIFTVNPSLLQNVHPERIAINSRATAEALSFFNARIGDITWSGMGFPTETWASLLFPELPETERLNRLWHLVLKITRADQPDAVAAWKAHVEDLTFRADYLNQKNYRKLHYRSTGTNLTIELHKKHRWISAGGKNSRGVPIVPNIPTEEVFTAPLQTGVNGVVRSTKPLNYNGATVDNFSLTFESGRIVDFEAEKGYEVLKSIIGMDEGSHFLGEVALVPHDSPVSQSNMVFLHTLYDENASCHLAIGRAYPMCVEGGTQMSADQLAEHGCNYSLAHVDFMIGSDELDIDGITADGVIEPLFRNGKWAF
ncbi:aminopeptidase [Alicyclobacillus sp. SO9]|uniref:aminopeptidase n=1 Tax=Alicyclobacillus sp. SO9 TaxID=2665646 RepID=UPI0018E8448D|nr:aminopeptidase [Alicyclobacillus sp. SO9]QQE77090.1 aminopeptidase [Alicyclobacillus sp. SO9]